MHIGENIAAWRQSKGHSVEALAKQAGMAASSLTAIESGELDPPVSMLAGLASVLRVPPSWLYGHPKHLQLLASDTDPSDPTEAQPDSPHGPSLDPVAERILVASSADQSRRELYVLLTALLENGEPKLLRAAEMSLRSLLKQAKQTTVPWESRQPGHFEPPSD
jgi:transcriptional regulator with XRE-family HTH domain